MADIDGLEHPAPKDTHTQIVYLKQKHHKNDLPFQNDGQFSDFHFESFQFWRNLNQFSKGNFYNEIWYKIGNYKYINIAKIKILTPVGF